MNSKRKMEIPSGLQFCTQHDSEYRHFWWYIWKDQQTPEMKWISDHHWYPTVRSSITMVQCFSVSVFRCTLHLPGHPSGLGSVSSSSCAHSTAPLFRFQTQSIFCTCFVLFHVPHARFFLTVIHPGTAKCNWHTSWHLAVGHGRTTASRSMLKIFGMRVRWFQRTTYTPDDCIPRVTACEIIR